MKKIVVLASLAVAGVGSVAAASTKTAQNDVLVKLVHPESVTRFKSMMQGSASAVEDLGNQWVHIKVDQKNASQFSLKSLAQHPDVLYVQPNYKIHLLTDYRLKDKSARAQLRKLVAQGVVHATAAADNPPLPTRGSGGSGADPKFSEQWGMNDIGVKQGWQKANGTGMVVAVIDTGVDYTHEDLVDNMWRNPGETGTDAQGRDKSSNGIDDDSNGYVDDVIGWDFVSNDNKPFDLAVDPIQLLMGGGNPGHGTHCAGNVGARSNNGKGVAGVAPDVRIMALRFLSEKGEGDTAGAVKAINYAVKMGVKVTSNSWGSEGEDPNDGASNQALHDAIENARQHGSLFIAAAGNGHQGVGYDNDTDPKPGYPASYKHDNIISVAALDKNDQLGAFSNWGRTTVHIGAPGVQVFSTTVGGKYSDTVIDMYGIHATWDGTSMATPHVAGAAALYWSAHPNASMQDVKSAVLNSAKPVSSLNGKSVTGGKLNVAGLMQQ